MCVSFQMHPFYCYLLFQFYIQLIYRAAIGYTLTSKNLRFNLYFEPIKYALESKRIFLTLQYRFFYLFRPQKSLKTSSKIGQFSKIEVITAKAAQTVQKTQIVMFTMRTNLPKTLDLLIFSIYRGFLPYATFGTWKKSHYPKIALAKFLFYVRSSKINSP